jgi:hypothetical protein
MGIIFFIFSLAGLFSFYFNMPFLSNVLLLIFSFYYLILSTKVFKIKNINVLHLYIVYVLVTTVSNINQEIKILEGKSLGGYSYGIIELYPISSGIWYYSNLFLFAGFEFSNIHVKAPFSYIFKSKFQFSLLLLLSVLIDLSYRFYQINLPGTVKDFFYLIPIFALFFFAILGFKENIKYVKNMAFVLMLLHTSLGILFGFLRFEIIIAPLVFALGAFLGKGSLKVFFEIRFLPLVILSVFFITLFEFFGDNRSELAEGSARISSLSIAYSEEKVSEVKSDFTALDRMSVLAQISNIVDLRNNSEKDFFQESFLPLIIALVPRFIWPDKPKIALGVWFALEIGQSVETDNWFSNSINMTIPGHIFLNFGWVGLTVISFLLGRYLKFLWCYVQMDNVFNLLGILFGGYLYYIAIQGLGADLQFFVTATAIFLIFKLLNKLFVNETSLYRPSLEGE